VFYRGAVACTGTEFCKLAIAETKGFAKWLVGEMEERLPEFDQQLRLHVTGCTNSCGQSWIADIGLEGKKIKKDGKMVDAFYFCVGGAVGEHAGIARRSAIARRRRIALRPSSGCCAGICAAQRRREPARVLPADER
jgi:sulfite reductase (ferredoxin)